MKEGREGGRKGGREEGRKEGILHLFRSPPLLSRPHLIFIPVATAAPEFLPGILSVLIGLHFPLHLRWKKE